MRNILRAQSGPALTNSCPTAFEANDRYCIRPTVYRLSPLVEYLCQGFAIVLKGAIDQSRSCCNPVISLQSCHNATSHTSYTILL